jgi:hypothetical protein
MSRFSMTLQDEAGGAAATRIGAQPLKVTPQQGLTNRLVGVLPILPLSAPRKHAQDHPADFVGKKRFECTPTAACINRHQFDHPFRQQIANHEDDVNLQPCAAVVAPESGKPIGTQCRHDIAKRRFRIRAAACRMHARRPHRVGKGTSQSRRRLGLSPQGGRENIAVEVVRRGHVSPN